jgi:hypothetical protein
MFTAKCGRQLIAMRTGRTADDATLVAGMGGGFVPTPVVGHRAFDALHQTPAALTTYPAW